MAKYFLHVKVFSRAKGSRATKAAAYRAGEHIRDERTGEGYNYSDRSDIAAKEIILPSALRGRADMGWALDRSVLWNAAEFAGRHRNSRVAREIQVIVPPELSPAQRVALVRGFAVELADRYGNAVDYAVHRPRRGADERHHHAHILMTMRQVGPQGMGARTTLELSGSERDAIGLGPSKDDLLWMRERWAVVTNEAFQAAGLADRVDHRSYSAQGLDIEPKPHIPKRIYYQEKLSGRKNPAGEQLRARYAERVAARQVGPEEHARVVRRQKEEGREQILERAKRPAAAPKKGAYAPLTHEQRKEQQRQYYYANRERMLKQQRERFRRNQEVRGVKPRAFKKRVAAPAPATAQQAAEKWRALHAGQARGAAAAESVQRWREYRASQAQGASVSEGPGRTLDAGSGGADAREDAPGRARGTHRGPGMGG